MTTSNDTLLFQQLGLRSELLSAITELGYEQPSPIQAATIPELMQGKDLVGQAQTGTGKTAAFALPILNSIDIKQKQPQALILAPTRELAIQVAEAFQSYAAQIKGLHILPIYGGQSYSNQLRQLKRGVHIVVGTPGRVMDHMRRSTLNLDHLKTLVLDEADEMLRMGFIDDVEWVIENTPKERQVVLFSATMPKQIRHIAQSYLNAPTEITIKEKTATAATINQRYWLVSGFHKLDAMTRILEAEDFDAMIVFVRTKLETTQLAEKLEARGFSAAALNGDIQQKQREEIVDKLKKGKIDILVGTDVVARGLDVERISHVVNYDIPYDAEAYVHRIGRTGRAGRTGEAILFVAPRERRMLGTIERATRQKITPMVLPTAKSINERRIERFNERLLNIIDNEDFSSYTDIVQDFTEKNSKSMSDVAAALMLYAQGNQPFLLNEAEPKQKSYDDYRDSNNGSKNRKHTKDKAVEKGMQRYKLDVGRKHGVKPGQIVGAIANEADLDSANIGAIQIKDNFSLVDLPEGMPKELLKILKKAKVCQRPLNLSVDSYSGKPKGKKPHKKKSKANQSKKSKKTS